MVGEAAASRVAFNSEPEADGLLRMDEMSW